MFSASTAAGLNLVEGDIVLDEVRSLIELFEVTFQSECLWNKLDLGSLCHFCLPLIVWISTEAKSELYNWTGVQVAKDHPVRLGRRPRSGCLSFFIFRNIYLGKIVLL